MKMGRLALEIVCFGAADVVATSGLPVSQLSISSMNDQYYILKSSEGAKGFSDWFVNNPTDDFAYTYFLNDDWWGNSNTKGNENTTYIWYGSGHKDTGNLVFNTHNQSYQYYLDNSIPLPTSD